MNQISMDSMAIILLCSNLGLGKTTDKYSKPFTVVQWHSLSEKLLNSAVKRPEALLSMDEAQIRDALFLSSDEAKRIATLLSRKGNIAIELERLASKGIHIVTRADKEYPQRLKKVLRKKAPPLIYYAGDIKLASQNAIAVVGSRNVEKWDEDFTRLIAKSAAATGYNIISGGAKGVDSIAENTSLTCGGKTVSIVSDTLSKRIIAKDVRNAIMQGNLLLMSFVHPEASFKGFNAMDRNKYVYALSQCAVVVTSANRTGGTWAGAFENIQNRWVPLLVRNDSDVPEGNKELLKLGAFSLTEQELIKSGFRIPTTNEDHDECSERSAHGRKSEPKEKINVMGEVKQITFTLL